MSREVVLAADDYAGSHPLYFVAYLVEDSRYVRGSTLETYNASHWAQYAATLTQDGVTGDYYADFPAVPTGVYMVKLWEQLGGSPATSDATGDPIAEGEFDWFYVDGGATGFASGLVFDGAAFINEFAEPITYTPSGGSPVSLLAVVNRNPPLKVDQDGQTTTDYIQVDIRNDAATGRSSITPGRDSITVSGRFGGAAREHLVKLIEAGDHGVWRLDCR